MTAEAGWLLMILDRMGPEEREMLLDWIRCVEPAIWDRDDYSPQWLEALPLGDEEGDG